jgi:hypothetical protein
VLEEEVYEESSTKEKLLKIKGELEKEIQTLRWYFKPLAKQATEEKNPELQTSEFNFAEAARLSVRAELDAMMASMKGKTQQTRSIQELQEALGKALGALPADFREDLSFELEDLMKFMTQAEMKTKVKLSIFVALVENKCDAGIVRELGNVTLDLVEGKLHPMDSPEMIIKFSYRDSAGDEDPKAVRICASREQRTNMS